MPRPRRRQRATPGFKWEGNRLVPLSTTTWNEGTQDWDINGPNSTPVAVGESSQDGTTGTVSTVPPKENDDYVAPEAEAEAEAEPEAEARPTDPNYGAPDPSQPHWSDTSQVGGGGHENAPGTTPVTILTEQPSEDPEDSENPLSNRLLQSNNSSVGGGYGKSRKREISRGQMNLTSGRNRSILTS